MPSAITRKTALVFGGSLTPAGNVEAFGSKAGGSPVSTNDPAVIQTPQWLLGWKGALASGLAPFWQDDNAVQFVLSYQLAYLLERGMPEWDAGTTYFTDDPCRIGNTWYVSKVDNNLNNTPVGAPNPSWDLWTNVVMQGANVNKAWVCFDGTGGLGACPMLGGFNVASVTKLATGIYVINFQSNLPTANYGFTGSAGAKDGANSGSGDNNVICGGTPGQVGLKTQSQLKVFCWEPNLSGSGSLEDSQAITVQVFGA